MVAGKTRPDISKPTYVIVVWVSVSLVALAAGAGNPFGKDFQSLAVPALLLFASLLWLLLSSKFGWKIAATCVALAASLMLSVLSLFKAENAVAFVVAISAGIVVQLIVLSF
jgi:hypothetical protein